MPLKFSLHCLNFLSLSSLFLLLSLFYFSFALPLDPARLIYPVLHPVSHISSVTSSVISSVSHTQCPIYPVSRTSSVSYIQCSITEVKGIQQGSFPLWIERQKGQTQKRYNRDARRQTRGEWERRGGGREDLEVRDSDEVDDARSGADRHNGRYHGRALHL